MSSPKILIVDDQPTMRAVVVAALTPLGYSLLEAGDGETAIKMAVELEPDVILLDVMMPGVGGIEVTRRLREAPTTREIPIVILTALDDKQSRAEALAAGADDILSKPTDLTELRLRVQTICRLNRYRLLLEQRSSVAALVEGSEIATLICTTDGTPLFANEFARSAFDVVSRTSVADGVAFEPLDAATRDRLVAAAESARAQSAPVYISAAGIAAAAGIRELIVSATSWLGLPAIRVDAIESHRASELESQLRHRERLASIGQLSASVAHELSSVLTIIDLAAQRPDLFEEQAEGTRAKIRAAASRGAGLVRQLLKTSRPSASRSRGVPVSQLRDDIVPGVQALLLGEVSISVIADEECSIPLSRADLEQVVLNLVTNARDAGADTIGIVVRNHDGRVELAVRDNGRGIDPKVAGRIGTAFVSSRDEKGHGLGVWAVKRILEDVGGALKYTAREGGGTIATADIPVVTDR